MLRRVVELRLNRFVVSGPNCINTELFRSVDSLIIIAGLGGNTTHEYLPEIIKVACSIPITDISAVATTPFLFEGEDRISKALKTASMIKDLGRVRISLLNNEDLVKRFPELNLLMPLR